MSINNTNNQNYESNDLQNNESLQQIKTFGNFNQTSHQTSIDFTSFKQNFQPIGNQNYLLNQFEMITKQNQFLQQIKEQINKKKSTGSHQILFCGSNPTAMDLLPMDSSFDVSNISGVQIYDDQPFKTKFGQEFQKSLLASALNQVQQNCSNQTYDVIRNCVLNSKQKQFQLVTQKQSKLAKKFQQLETTFIIKSTLLAQAQTQLKEALIKIQQIEEEKKKIKLKANQLSQKQKRVFKLESSIVFKQKLFHQGKKRYQRQKNLFLSVQQRLNQLYRKMQDIWEYIIEKMDQSSKLPCCQGQVETTNSCWKKQVMRKCKQQLIEQRQLLREQEQQIQKEYDVIQALSQQVKNLLNEKQSSTNNTDPFSSQPSSLIIFNNR